jgi:putative RNA 2'-phosphotransferase
MNSAADPIKLSKFLSLVLRHSPQTIGLTLDAQGWADIAELIDKADQAGQKLDTDLLMRLVRDSDKQRFTLSPDGSRIRAAQGHSVPVDLGLAAVEPPAILYHGTALTNLEAILSEGLKPGKRQQVHLSADTETARKVGARHGKPVVLKIAADDMHRSGLRFTRAENGVWLADHVPARFLALHSP